MSIQRHKRILGSLVIGAFASSVAFGATTPTTTSTQQTNTLEKNLLISMTALQGDSLSKSEYETQAFQLITQYDKTAPVNGRTDRLLSAMTTLGMATPAQAAGAKTDIESAVTAEIATHPEMTRAQIQQYTVKTTMTELGHSFTGAQFSGCVWMGIGAGAVLAAAILSDVYANSMSAPPGYQINQLEQNMIMATSGILYGVSGVMFLYMMFSNICD